MSLRIYDYLFQQQNLIAMNVPSACKNLFYLFVILSSLSISEAAQTAREKDENMYKMYEPENLNTYGFVLPIGSKVPEVHQLANDLQYSFFNYQDKSKYEEIAAKITELDPSYPSAYLMQSFYVPDDTPKYKELVTKAYELSKIHPLESERNMVQADYNLLITEDYDQALTLFQNIADLYPESSVAIWCVGMVYYYSRQNKKALAAFNKSVELNPNLAKGYESISWIYSTKSDKEVFDEKKALEYLNIAIEKGASAINDQYYADHESYVYYLNGLYEKTISNINHYYTFGDKYKDSKLLQKVLQWSKEKLADKSTVNE